MLSWTNLLSKIPTSSPGPTTDRLVAVACAMATTPGSAVASGASGANEITRRAREFEDWLSDADTDQDAFVRRLLLLMVCDKTDQTTPPERIRSFVKELHRHVNRR